MAVEVSSPPDFIQEDVIDLEIMVPSGLCRFTLREANGDRYETLPDGMGIVVIWNKATMWFNLSRVDYTSVTPRTIRTQVKKPTTSGATLVADIQAAS